MQHNGLIYSKEIENILLKIEFHLKCDYSFSRRTMALLLLQQDEAMSDLVESKEAQHYLHIKNI